MRAAVTEYKRAWDAYCVRPNRIDLLKKVEKLLELSLQQNDRVCELFFQAKVNDIRKNVHTCLEYYERLTAEYNATNEYDELVLLGWSHVNAASLYEDEEDAEMMMNHADAAISIGRKQNDPLFWEIEGSGYVNKGKAWYYLDDFDKEIEAYDTVIKKFTNKDNEKIKHLVCTAIYYKGLTLREQSKNNLAIIEYDKVLEIAVGCKYTPIHITSINCWNEKSDIFLKQEKPLDAVLELNQVIEIYRGKKNVQIRKAVAQALLKKSDILKKLGKSEESIEIIKSISVSERDNEEIQQRIAFINSVSENPELDVPQSIDEIIRAFSQKDKDSFFSEMKEREKRTQAFLGKESNFNRDDKACLFFDLREWNSYTPAVPDQHEIDRGGGYFIRYNNQGLVIDPGFDFIKNFGAVDGRLCDIDHIFITHAHNDHTQDFESILSLLFQYNKRNKTKKVNLYLSQGAARKFSGYLPLRDASYIGRVEVLNQGNKENPQVIHLAGLEGASVTVLKAYHDDSITLDYSVGLGFELEFPDGMRRVVFTGDTGLFPLKMNEEGKVIRKESGDPALDIDSQATRAIFNQYPITFREPDLLIPHIGSIKEDEFKSDHRSKPGGGTFEESVYFYPNHLGLRGLVLLLARMKPKVVVVSEFGEELKNIRFDLVRGIEKLLRSMTTPIENSICLVPGDVTVVFDIKKMEFLCHDKKTFIGYNEIGYLEVPEPIDSRFYCNEVSRTYIFRKPLPTKKQALNFVKHYHIDVEDYGYPYNEKAPTQ